MFEDSVGKKTIKGVDVGQELETRSFVEGATPSRAIWRYGRVMDPYDELLPDPNRTPNPMLDRRLPVEQLLKQMDEDLRNTAVVLGVPTAGRVDPAKVDAE